MSSLSEEVVYHNSLILEPREGDNSNEKERLRQKTIVVHTKSCDNSDNSDIDGASLRPGKLSKFFGTNQLDGQSNVKVKTISHPILNLSL
jgi:ABC-type uncharacterized transport system involved in gliding motility auxiliary subunit